MFRLFSKLILSLAAPMAFAGLVEVNSSTYYRESGSPVTEFLEVTLENAGEIRVSNVNLQDDAIEPTAATEVVLNGSPLMQPFTLPTGGSTVFPLAAGTHILEVTLAGKPDGGVKILFYEDKPDAPEQGVGWQLLDDGTALHRATGLIWHRNLASPGLGLEDFESGYQGAQMLVGADTDPYAEVSISSYITRLNDGDFGTDSVDGNAGLTDWRAPTSSELFSVLDFRANPPLTDASGSVGDPIIFVSGVGFFGGMLPGEPLIFCWNDDEYGGDFDPVVERCPRYHEVYNFVTNDTNWGYIRPWGPATVNINFYVDFNIANSYNLGSVWPVRGGQPQ